MITALPCVHVRVIAYRYTLCYLYFAGLCVAACTDTCLGGRKQHAHYHCPCGRIITRKDSMVCHALMHEKKVSIGFVLLLFDACVPIYWYAF